MIKLKKINNKSWASSAMAYGFVAIVILFAGTVSFVLSKNIAPNKSHVQGTKKISVVKKSNTSPTSIPETEIEKVLETKNSQLKKNNVAETDTSSPVVAETIVSNTTSTSREGSQSQTTQNNTTESKANVSINGASGFEVKITDSANQCDVLIKALEQGKIQSLNMRYDNTLGSNAVYQINGIGKDNSVWWTYTVNGNSPSQGCSYVKANNGDSIEWRYIGS